MLHNVSCHSCRSENSNQNNNYLHCLSPKLLYLMVYNFFSPKHALDGPKIEIKIILKLYSLPYQTVSNGLFWSPDFIDTDYLLHIKEKIFWLGLDMLIIHLYTQQPLPVTSERLPLSSSSASVFDGHFWGACLLTWRLSLSQTRSKTTNTADRESV